jgi:hypothetical protein
MDIFVFSSKNLTNIWAGIGARKWAVSKELAENPATVTKAKSLRIGSLGLLYCSETQSFTAPFLVSSAPEVNVSVSNIWPEEWWLPFSIFPLGSPNKQMSKDEGT